jgi:hypothetical protein
MAVLRCEREPSNRTQQAVEKLRRPDIGELPP